MGYNDNTTDFYVDAVLTDVGREKLARNDGSFSAARFRFADDEIDYRFWNALTGSSNKDDKILDTPIFEAFGNETIALKYPLVTIRNSTLQYMPSIAANPSSVALKDRTDATGGGTSVVVSQQTTKSQVIIPAEMIDVNYVIWVDNDLLYIPNQIPTAITAFGTARYILSADSAVTSATNGTQVTFVLRVQTLNSTIFDILAGATTAKPRTINTTVTVFGMQSGLNVKVPVSILEFVG